MVLLVLQLLMRFFFLFFYKLSVCTFFFFLNNYIFFDDFYDRSVKISSVAHKIHRRPARNHHDDGAKVNNRRRRRRRLFRELFPRAAEAFFARACAGWCPGDSAHGTYYKSRNYYSYRRGSVSLQFSGPRRDFEKYMHLFP